VPTIQYGLDEFREITWNYTSSRKNKNKLLPTGTPEHIHNFPKNYGGEKHGIALTEEQLFEASEFTGVGSTDFDYISEEVRNKCRAIINDENLADIKANPKEASLSYRHLRQSLIRQQHI